MSANDRRQVAYARARKWIEEKGAVVVKPDGLTEGKGVVIAQSFEEAKEAIDAIWAGTLQQRGYQLGECDYVIDRESE